MVTKDGKFAKVLENVHQYNYGNPSKYPPFHLGFISGTPTGYDAEFGQVLKNLNSRLTI